MIGRATGSTARGAIIGAAVGGTAALSSVARWTSRPRARNDLENATVTPIEGAGRQDGRHRRPFDNALLFDLGSSNLRAGVRADLSDLARASELPRPRRRDRRPRLHGRLDGDQPELSERRAQAVRDYLVGQGIAASRTQAYGRGETEPLAGIPGTDPANRRVEIAIYASEQYRNSL